MVDHGDQAKATVAARTGRDAEPEGPAHQLRAVPAVRTPLFRIRRVRVHLPVATLAGRVSGARLPPSTAVVATPA